jgi:hypothetical protein
VTKQASLFVLSVSDDDNRALSYRHQVVRPVLLRDDAGHVDELLPGPRLEGVHGGGVAGPKRPAVATRSGHFSSGLTRAVSELKQTGSLWMFIVDAG